MLQNNPGARNMENFMEFVYYLFKISQIACFVALGLWIVRYIFQKKNMSEYTSLVTILSKTRTILFLIFVSTSVLHFLRPYVLNQFSYSIIADVEIAGKKVEYCEEINDSTGEKRLVYCVDGNNKSISETLMSKNFSWIVYVDQGSVFDIYRNSDIVEPLLIFEYKDKSYSIYLFDYLDELTALKNDGSDDSTYHYFSSNNEFRNW